MKEELQNLLHQLVLQFGLKPVTIPFTERFSQEDVKLYNLLVCPMKFESNMFSDRLMKLASEGKTSLVKKHIWKIYIQNPRIQSLTSHFCRDDVTILEGSILLHEGKVFKSRKKEVHDMINETARRISCLNPKGKVSNDIKILLKKIKNE